MDQDKGSLRFRDYAYFFEIREFRDQRLQAWFCRGFGFRVSRCGGYRVSGVNRVVEVLGSSVR